MREFFRNEGRLIASVGPDVQHDFPIAVDMIAGGAIDVEPLVTHYFPLGQAQEAFSMFAQRRDGVIKAVLTNS
jgi:threonine dehydrogenase-like Zn-dependent dehydrogenase